MTDEQTATQPIEAQSYESTEETGTSDPGQAQATEQTAQSFLTQSEAEKTAPGEQESILRGEQTEKQDTAHQHDSRDSEELRNVGNVLPLRVLLPVEGPLHNPQHEQGA